MLPVGNTKIVARIIGSKVWLNEYLLNNTFLGQILKRLKPIGIEKALFIRRHSESSEFVLCVQKLDSCILFPY